MGARDDDIYNRWYKIPQYQKQTQNIRRKKNTLLVHEIYNRTLTTNLTDRWTYETRLQMNNFKE